MLLVKIKNSAELFWDTLDSEERRMIVYALAWVIGSALLALQRARREAFKRELLSDVIEAQAVSDGSGS